MLGKYNKRFIIIIVLLLILIYMYFFENIYIAIKLNWGISIPRGDSLIYKSDTCIRSYQLCPTYSVIKYKSKIKLKKINAIKWKNDKNNNFELEIYNELKDNIIDDKYMIDFNEPYLLYNITRYDGNKLYLIYFPENETLYIIEKLY
jgi:hypothetical protein